MKVNDDIGPAITSVSDHIPAAVFQEYAAVSWILSATELTHANFVPCTRH